MISGWDIGGAHIKVARCDVAGNLVDIIEQSCPLWQGIDRLQQALSSIVKQLNNADDVTVVTMTGELVDIFEHRQQGVSAILDCLDAVITNNIQVYSDQGWLSIQQAKQEWQAVASQNWHASASLAATYTDGLFVDIGSTSCDIIALDDGQAKAIGLSDHQRQQTAELVYTGSVRTPLIALSQFAPFNGHRVGLAAEVFATTGDVWILLGMLDAENINDISSDGKPWHANYCTTRLARLLGTDAKDHSPAQWQQLALWFAEKQQQLITEAILQVTSAHHQLAHDTPIIAAGIGRFIAQQCADRIGRPYLDLDNVLELNNPLAADHAPATAIALLAAQQLIA